MTSDAKLGLLLGLILIIAIVIAINGLPSLLSTPSNNSADTEKSIINIATEDIVHTAKKTVNILRKHNSPDIAVKSAAEIPIIPVISDTAATIDTKSSLPEKNINSYKLYTVKANENLAVIAKNFYGQEIGNTLANIEKIAAFNNLKSVDRIYQGQHLKMPSVAYLQNNSFVVNAHSSHSQAKNNLTARRRHSLVLPTVSVIETISSRRYIVKKGDTLWSIAKKILKNPSRYTEIVKLNPQISSQDDLVPGAILTLPQKQISRR